MIENFRLFYDTSVTLWIILLSNTDCRLPKNRSAAINSNLYADIHSTGLSYINSMLLSTPAANQL